jgi:hypothetical protein
MFMYIFGFNQEAILQSWVTIASAEKIDNNMSNLVCFENKNMLFYIEKRSSLLQRWCWSSKKESS